MGTIPRLQQYRVIETLSIGYSSTAYLAKSVVTGARCVIKTFDRGDPSVASRHFKNELTVLSSLRHPNLISLLDFGTTLEHDFNFIVTEYFPGADFVSASKEASRQQFYSMIGQVCRALDYLHRHELVHGDLKPENIRASLSPGPRPREPIVKLIDLGYAKALLRKTPNYLEGSPHYLSPELINGSAPTFASDLYSFGVILYECLAGFPPFSGDHVGATLQGHLQKTPPPIQTEALRELHPVIAKLMAKDPFRRPASSGDLLRLVNAASTVEQIRLHTADTWLAHTTSAPLCGREQFLSRGSTILASLSHEDPRSQPRCILITGERGSGKTRLLKHIVLEAHTRDIGVLVLGSSLGQHTMQTACQILQARATRPQRTPFLLAFDGATNERFLRDPLQLLRRFPDFVRVLILAVDTWDIAPLALRHLRSTLAPVFALEEWELSPLSVPHIREAIMGALGVDTIDSALPTYLWRATGGNPMLLSELLAVQLDQEILEHDIHTITVRKPDLRPQSPSFLTEYNRALRTRLSGEHCLVAQLLATTSETLTIADIATLTQLDSEVARASCETLLHLGVARSESDHGCTSFRIAGSLVADAVLTGLHASDQLRVHVELGRWYRSRSDDQYSLERAAHHFSSAGMMREAYDASLMAAEKAASSDDFIAAARLYSMTLALDNRGPIPRAEIGVALTTCLLSLGHWADALKTLQNIPDIDCLPAETRVKVHLCRARHAYQVGDYARMQSEAARVLDMSHIVSVRATHVEATYFQGAALCGLDDRGKGQRLLLEAATQSRRLKLRRLLSWCIQELASTHWKAGNYRLALSYMRRHERLSSSGRGPATIPVALSNIGILRSDLGFYARARSAHKRAVGIGNQRELGGWVAGSLVNIGETYRSQGRWRPAIKCYRAALHRAQGSGGDGAALIALSNIAQVLGRTGDVGGALGILKHRLGRSRMGQSIQSSLYLLSSWIICLISTGYFPPACKVACFGLRLAQNAKLWQSVLEMSMLQALSLSEVGKNEDAHKELVEAITVFDSRSPFDVRVSSKLALAQIDLRRGARVSEVETVLQALLACARKKKMRWHLAWGLGLWGEALLGVSRAQEAEAPLQEAVDVSTAIADRTMFWQSTYLLGRAYEQMLRYERAVACYRMAALTVHEIGMNIREERYRNSFLNQPRVRDVIERYERVRGEVGRKARYDLAQVSRSERASRKMLGALNVIGQKLSSILDLDELMASVLDLAVENVRAERGIIFLSDDATGEMRAACGRGVDKEALKEIDSFSRSVVTQVAQGRTLLTVDVGKDPALSAYKSLVLHEIKSILCVPMRTRGKVVGVIYLDTRRAAQLFTDRERSFVESFANQAAIAIENARLFGDVTAENARLRKEVEGRSRFESLIGTSPAMTRLTETIGGILENDCNVLILGESGTGKELVARAIHYNGPRRRKKFVAIDCGSLPENLLEAELFGHVRGAFTGAERDRIGLIAEAHGGTLFLDEITNTTVGLQARLLRVLQEHEVRRLGENTPRRVDVRIVAATNGDVRRLMSEGRFRQDLYYRLNVVTIEVPPLRERREDVSLLATHFLRELTGRDGRPAKRLGPGVVEALERYEWPGNVRELRNVVERLAVLTPGSVITLGDLPEGMGPARAPAALIDAKPSGERSDAGGPRNGNGQKTGEQIMIEDTLRRFGGDKAKAARFIGWHRQKLYRRMKSFGIPTDYGRSL